jgi:hypothetical protein
MHLETKSKIKTVQNYIITIGNFILGENDDGVSFP